ncbi:hypothetical protein CDAR_97821 [Caerostris darwini]|uniref:Uncharacterized protein n=1 Tax=Caerostris darwini TaxID=1538125 RepID=A0AAV4ME33_9ARAC|nr:hypothetical protein CDAR_97821 [Caerostris darwini]
MKRNASSTLLSKKEIAIQINLLRFVASPQVSTNTHPSLSTKTNPYVTALSRHVRVTSRPWRCGNQEVLGFSRKQMGPTNEWNLLTYSAQDTGLPF